MSKVKGPARWQCDKCRADGGEVNEHETIPYRWLSLDVLVGTPQLASEMKPRRVHLCEECSGELLNSMRGDDDVVERLKSMWQRPPEKGAYA